MIKAILIITLLIAVSGCSYRMYFLAVDQLGSGHSTTVQVNPDVDKRFELSPTLDIAP